ncbi:hypothetical protein KSS87_021049 [Heliosperma pusillum]|nr:hypothetical protein KSS87_021049 [Heliosperma pusillum]
MKRKRSHKNKKSKKLVVEASKSDELIAESPINSNNNVNEDDNDDESCSSSSEEDEIDNGGGGGVRADVEASASAAMIKPEPPAPVQPVKVVSIRPGGVFQRPPPTAVYGRVRVKLKTAAVAKPPSPPKLQPEPQPQPQVPVVEARVGDGEGVKFGTVVDKSRQEVVMKEDGNGGGSVGGEKEGIRNLGLGESKKSGGGTGIRIVLSKSSSYAKDSGGKKSSLSPRGGNGKDIGGKKSSLSLSPPGENSKDIGGEKSSLSPPGENSKDIGGNSSRPSLSPPSGNEKDTSGKSSSLSPPGGNDKDIGGSSRKSQSSSLGSPGGNVKDIGGKGLSSSLSPPSGNDKDIGGKSSSSSLSSFDGNTKDIDEKKSSLIFSPSGGKTKDIDGKKSNSSLSPPSENAKDVGGKNSSPSLSQPGVNAKDIGEKNSSASLSPPSGNAKDCGGNMVSPKANEEEEVVEVQVMEEKPKSRNKQEVLEVQVMEENPKSLNNQEVLEVQVIEEKPKLRNKQEAVEVQVVEQKSKFFNRQELEASLEVIKKVMKMDAAEPFNVPVNPIELGIPDYFDIIDTPMDFGTICRNLERGAKYMDSEDVYTDAQYIWNNCFKYNNKGDYIVDLMKRVKKNFLKYWMGAGLYTDLQTRRMSDSEGVAVDEPTTSGHGKKFKKGKGFKRHKDDCMCAICIMKRRRREREAREAHEAREAGIFVPSPQFRVSQTNTTKEFKQEVNSHAESPGDDTSSYMEASPDGDGDAEMEDGETRLEGIASQYVNQQKAGNGRIEFHDISDRSGDISERPLQNDKGDDVYSHDEANIQDDLGSRMMIDVQKQPSVHPEEPRSAYLQQRHELLELEKKRQRLRLIETFRDLENPMLSGLCGTLFPNNKQSVWNGANSLLQCQRSRHRKSGIHEAVASFLTPSCKSASSLK